MNALSGLEFECIEEISEDILEDSDGFGIGLVEVDPDLNSIAGRIVNLGRDKTESIYLVASSKILSQQEEGQLFINLLFLRLSFADLEDEAASLLILFILPLRFDAFLEELDGVDFFEGLTNKVAEYVKNYDFCLLF